MSFHNQDAATQAAMMGNYYDEQERQYIKRQELLSKFVDGGMRYNNEQLFRNVIEGLIRGADPLVIIESLINMNKELQDRVKEYLLYKSTPIPIKPNDH